MIDKIWSDWQNRDPLNAQSFYGGSLESINNLTAYNAAPTGVGPYLDVSTRALVHLEMEEFMLTCFA
jgi:hypothetical protein